MKKLCLTLMLLMLAITACAAPSSPGEKTYVEEGGQNRSPLAQPTAPAQSASPISVPPTPQLPNAVEGDVVTTLRALVAAKLQVALAELTLVSAEEVIWRDASLGCPQPGEGYAQVLTPGWRVVFADAAGREYDVHTSEKPESFVICTSTDAAPAPLPPEVYRDNPAVEAAIKALVESAGVKRETLSVVAVEPVQWSNSCLGCAKPGENCLMVITPGYRISLKSGETTYTLHTDRSGGRVILCENPESALPRADS